MCARVFLCSSCNVRRMMNQPTLMVCCAREVTQNVAKARTQYNYDMNVYGTRQVSCGRSPMFATNDNEVTIVASANTVRFLAQTCGVHITNCTRTCASHGFLTEISKRSRVHWMVAKHTNTSSNACKHFRRYTQRDGWVRRVFALLRRARRRHMLCVNSISCCAIGNIVRSARVREYAILCRHRTDVSRSTHKHTLITTHNIECARI